MDIGTRSAIKATMLHYAQLFAQLQREYALRDGDLFVDVQCKKCGLYHASAPCHQYSERSACDVV